MWFCSRLGTYKCCVCDVTVKKPMAAHLLICILLVYGDIMWHSGFGELLLCPRGWVIETRLFQWPFVEMPWHMEVHSNIMMALSISACAWLHVCHSEHAYAGKAVSDPAYYPCIWVCESWRQTDVRLCTSTMCMCPEYLEALLSPHWSISTTLPSLPRSGQRTDFPGAHVEVQRCCHSLPP